MALNLIRIIIINQILTDFWNSKFNELLEFEYLITFFEKIVKFDQVLP